LVRTVFFLLFFFCFMVASSTGLCLSGNHEINMMMMMMVMKLILVVPGRPRRLAYWKQMTNTRCCIGCSSFRCVANSSTSWAAIVHARGLLSLLLLTTILKFV